jgi:hypothetical protein
MYLTELDLSHVRWKKIPIHIDGHAYHERCPVPNSIVNVSRLMVSVVKVCSADALIKAYGSINRLL